jgi:hypothetical protein
MDCVMGAAALILQQLWLGRPLFSKRPAGNIVFTGPII